jgi:ATP-binding protein involved in chromosome partitioning
LKDARKALKMFQKVAIPVLGIIENMSIYHCDNCGHEAFLFGKEGGEKLSEETGVPVIGRLPLNPFIQEYADNGKTAAFYQDRHSLSAAYLEAAEKLLTTLAALPKDRSSIFGKIEVKND